MAKDPLTYDISRAMGGKSINQQLWEKLDGLVDKLKAGEVSLEEINEAKGEMRGIAFALSLMMFPLFDSVESISRESLKRYKARKAGEDYETPCVGPRWRDNPVAQKELLIEKRVEIPAPVRSSEIDSLDEKKKSMIKVSKFPAADLAEMFKVSVATVEAIRNS